MVDKPDLKKRTARIALGALIVLGLLLARMWWLQIVHGESYAELADGNRLRRLSLAAPRGHMYDDAGRVLADNRLVFTVSIVPGGLQDDADAIVQRLADILGTTRDELYEAIEGSRRTYPYEPIRVRRDVPPEVVVAIEENRMDLPGVILEQEPMRRYRADRSVAHLLGYLEQAKPEDLREFAGYRPDDLVGATGLERVYEAHLRGAHGSQQVEVNALHRAIRQLDSDPSIPGHDLFLTIDLELQEAAWKALEESIDELHDVPDRIGPPEGGAVVVLDVQTGAVRALAAAPTFDPNGLLSQERRNTYWAELNADGSRPLVSRGFQGAYAPGSAFKPITLLAALGQGVVEPDEVYNATGRFELGGTVWRDWTVAQGLPPAGPVDAVAALERSVNDYFYEMGHRTGITAIADTARALGLGRPTGIDVADNGGLVPDPAWKRNRHQQSWFAGDTVNVSIGQGDLAVTPLQMALVYMGLANRGTVMQPHLVQRIVSPTGETVFEHEPRVLTEQHAPDEHWDAIHAGLQAVVSGSRGTARNAFRDFPVPVAGKTGSAQVTGRDSHAWFAAYAPAEEPEIVVLVLVEFGGGGGGVAAPVACRVLAHYFSLPPAGEDAVCL